MKTTAGEMVDIYMKRKKLTCTELAQRMGKSPQAVSQQIKKDTFTVRSLDEIAEAMGMELVIDFREK